MIFHLIHCLLYIMILQMTRDCCLNLWPQRLKGKKKKKRERPGASTNVPHFHKATVTFMN